jgi:hypothetical protein
MRAEMARSVTAQVDAERTEVLVELLEHSRRGFPTRVPTREALIGSRRELVPGLTVHEENTDPTHLSAS